MLSNRAGSLGTLLVATLLWSPATSAAVERAPECSLEGRTLKVYGSDEEDDEFRVVRRPGPPVTIAVEWNDGNFWIDVCKFDLSQSPIDRIEVYGGDGEDIISVDRNLTYPTLLDGGPGDDELRGGGGRNTLQGGEGNDTLYGGPHNDKFKGDADPPAPPGKDTIHGGTGKDEVLDPGIGEDNIDLGPQDDEVIEESILDDIDEVFVPAALPDDYRGGAGDDVLVSAQDDDRLRGGPGDDVLKGGLGDTRLLGGSGDDRLIAGEGRDRLKGGSGNDLLLARDGTRDVISGGSGKDRAVVDRNDILRGVERVSTG